MIVQALVPSSLEMDPVEITKHGVSGKPLFYGKGREATSFVVQSKSDSGKVFFTYVLKVDGSTGELKLVSRNSPVKPLIERADEPAEQK